MSLLLLNLLPAYCVAKQCKLWELGSPTTTGISKWPAACAASNSLVYQRLFLRGSFHPVFIDLICSAGHTLSNRSHNEMCNLIELRCCYKTLSQDPLKWSAAGSRRNCCSFAELRQESALVSTIAMLSAGLFSSVKCRFLGNET